MKRGRGYLALVLLLASGLGCVLPPLPDDPRVGVTGTTPEPDTEPPAPDDAGPPDAGDAEPLLPDGGVVAPLGVVASGTACDWARPRYDLALDDGVVFAVDLSSPQGDDPDLHLYRAADPGHPVLIGRATGDDRLLVRGTGDVVIAEVSSWNGDCMGWQLRLDLATAAEAASLVPLEGSVRYRDRVHDEQGCA